MQDELVDEGWLCGLCMLKGVILSASLYVVMFIGHIIAAANDLDLLFRILAVLITLQTFLVGPSIILFERDCIHQSAMRIGMYISIPLGLGLGWAYADMGLHWSMILWPIGCVIVHILLERRLKYDSPVEPVDG